jgi:cytochrome b subunit of formate dehydrogenase
MTPDDDGPESLASVRPSLSLSRGARGAFSRGISLLAFLVLLTSDAALAQSNADCLGCHSDKSIASESGNSHRSLYVDAAAFGAARHARLKCIDCHAGFSADDIPHSKSLEPKPCASCHAGAAAVRTSSSHGKSAGAGAKACASCHGPAHTVGSAKSAPARAAIVERCAGCHEKESSALRASAHSADGVGATCLSCHAPHATRGAPSAAGMRACSKCHGSDATRAKTTRHDDVAANYASSVHGRTADGRARPNALCADCHGGHSVESLKNGHFAAMREKMPLICGKCHGAVTTTYSASSHGRALAAGVKGAPACADCHGEHTVQAIGKARTVEAKLAEAKACMRCHLDSADVRNRVSSSAKFVGSVEHSVHARALAKGNPRAATCSDCHGSHAMAKGSDPLATVNSRNVGATCGKAGCHDGVYAAYRESVHGKALAAGVENAPSCTKCHGEHTILAPSDPNSATSAQNISVQVCSPCHASVRMSERYGLPTGRSQTYEDSYHGLALRSGEVQAANCASCHGVHNIKASSDSTSTVARANLPHTCGKCHPNANERFAATPVHLMSSASSDSPAVAIVSAIYLVLIIGTIGGMLAWNGLDFFRKLRRKMRGVSHERHGRRARYLRMTGLERAQHAALLSSFFALVFTGFLLRFPNAWWVRGIRQIGFEWLFAERSSIHRIAALVMIAASLAHIGYLFTPRGRKFWGDMWLRLTDATELCGTLLFNLGRRRSRPRYGRFSFVEKAEYFALIWGTIVMGVTGVMLWADNFTMSWLSKLALDLGRVVHYYEAWLAFLAILVWHFYGVIFNPDVYPMNTAWLTGTITADEMEDEHPRELDEGSAIEVPAPNGVAEEAEE